MKHNTTAIGRPSRALRALLTLLGFGLSASIALAATAPNVSAGGDCGASVAGTLSDFSTGTRTTSGRDGACNEAWTKSAAESSWSGSAAASISADPSKVFTSGRTTASTEFAAFAEFGHLAVSASNSAGSGTGFAYFPERLEWTGSANSTGTANATFADMLNVTPPSNGVPSTVDVLVTGVLNSSGHSTGGSSGYLFNNSASFEVLLNGASIYSVSIPAPSDYGFSSTPVSFAFTAQPSDVIEIIGKVQASNFVITSVGNSISSDVSADLSITIDTLYTPGQLVAASGHNYASAIAPIPEPSTWALMVVGLLGIGASSARRRKAAALNAD